MSAFDLQNVMNSAHREWKRVKLASDLTFEKNELAFILTITIIYTISFILIFFIPANFWDDLAVKNNPDLIQMGHDSGLPTIGYFLTALFSLPNPDLFGRALIFLFYLFGIFFFRSMVISADFLPVKQINAISLISATLPLFQSRFLIASSYYSFSFFSFCVASYFLQKSMSKKHFYWRLPAYILFFLSFVTASFIVMYGLIIIILFLSLIKEQIKNNQFLTPLHTAFVLIRGKIDIFLLPPTFFVLKTQLFPTKGAFLDYNIVKIENIKDGILHIIPKTLDALLLLNANGVSWASFLIAFVFVAFIIMLTSRFVTPEAEDFYTATDGAMLISLCLSFIAVTLSVFPYVVVNREVTPFDFEDRNQITMILSVGSFLYFFLILITRRSLARFIVPVLVIWSIANNLTTYTSIIIDGHLQNAFVREAARNTVLRDARNFVFDTTKWPDLSRRRAFGSAQLNCLLKDAFGDERRYSTVLHHVPLDWQSNYAMLKKFRLTGSCFRDYAGGEPYLVFVTPGHKKLDVWSAASLSATQIWDKSIYNEELNDLINLIVIPMPSELLSSAPTN